MSLWVLVALSFVLRAFLVYGQGINPDEYQNLHASWAVAQGAIPYRDFWDNHSPLSFYLLAPLTGALEGDQLVLGARWLSFALCGVVFYLMHRIASRLYGPVVALIALVLLGYMDLVNTKFIEVRPDHWLVSLWLLSLLVLLRGSPGLRSVAASGALLGAAWTVTPKALFPLAAVGIAQLFVHARAAELRRLVVLGSTWTAAFLVPVAASFALMSLGDAADDFWYWVIAFNFTTPPATHFAPLWYMRDAEHIPFWVLSATGLALAGWGSSTEQRERQLVAVTTLALVAIHMWLMPRPQPQSTTVFLPLLAIFAGVTVVRLAHIAARKKVVRLLRVPVLVGIFAAAVLYPVLRERGALDRASRLGRVHHELRRMRALLALTDPDDAILVERPIAVTRPSAYFYDTLTDIILHMHEEGLLPLPDQPSLRASLGESGCRFLWLTQNLRKVMDDEAREFVTTHYTPAGLLLQRRRPDGEPWPRSLRIAGRLVRLKEGRGRYDAPVAGEYVVRRHDGARVLVDGRVVSGPIHLDAGRHLVEADRDLARLIIRTRVKWDREE